MIGTTATTFHRETVEEAGGAIASLAPSHLSEADPREKHHPDPDWDFYQALEDTGVLRIYTVRDGSGGLAGYAVLVVRESPHFRGSVRASQDLLYVQEEFRSGRLGIEFLGYIEEQLRQEGVEVIHHAAKLSLPALRTILSRLDYTPTEVIFQKWL